MIQLSVTQHQPFTSVEALLVTESFGRGASRLRRCFLLTPDGCSDRSVCGLSAVGWSACCSVWVQVKSKSKTKIIGKGKDEGEVSSEIEVKVNM